MARDVTVIARCDNCDSVGDEKDFWMDLEVPHPTTRRTVLVDICENCEKTLEEFLRNGRQPERLNGTAKRRGRKSPAKAV